MHSPKPDIMRGTQPLTHQCPVLYLSCLHKPLFTGAYDHWQFGAPVVWVAVLEVLLVNHLVSHQLQHCSNKFLC